MVDLHLAHYVQMNGCYERGAGDLTVIEMLENTCVKVSIRSLLIIILTQTAVHLYDLPVVPDSFDVQS